MEAEEDYFISKSPESKWLNKKNGETIEYAWKIIEELEMNSIWCAI